MIAAHRARHRRIFLALALLLPILLFVALRARPRWPENATLPAGVESFADDAPGAKRGVSP